MEPRINEEEAGQQQGAAPVSCEVSHGEAMEERWPQSVGQNNDGGPFVFASSCLSGLAEL